MHLTLIFKGQWLVNSFGSQISRMFISLDPDVR